MISQNLSWLSLPNLRFGFQRGRVLPVILQAEAAECGLSCLVMVAAYYGYCTDLLTVRHRFSFSLRGASLKDIISVASEMHLSARPLRIDLDELQYLQTPCILHWNLNHFVVLKEVNLTRSGRLCSIVVHDPASGAVTIPIAEVSSSFTGVAVELAPSAGFTERHEKQKVSVRALFGRVIGLKRSVLKVLVLAGAMEIFALVSPFYMQLVVDNAILSADRGLLAVLALGFGMLLLIQTAIGLFRSWLVIYISTHLNLQWMANVFTHLMRLPMNYFEKRHLGDVVSRFGAIQEIQRTLSNAFIEAILDGLLAVFTLTIMFVYSPALCLVVLIALSVYLLLRIVMYHPLLEANEQHIAFQAKEQTLFLESIRGIQAIKLFNHDDDRRARWLNALSASTNRDIGVQKMMLGTTTAHHLLAGIENIVIIWLGAGLAMSNVLSVGMLLAFISYKTTFSTRVYSLIDKWMDLKMMALQSERLADILLSRPESDTPDLMEDASRRASPSIRARHGVDHVDIKMCNVSFRYSDNEPWIVKDFDLTIREGESVALIGGSGSGKTTVLKLLLGLLKPNHGEIRIGGVLLGELGTRDYRNLIGAVMQDDTLLSGSIAENISFFDTSMDLAWVVACADSAAIAAEIGAMPMGYQTLIGDMGTSLSGGQKQRVLLARALYKRPKILFLDEATSQLDVGRENEVNEAIKRLALTRIIAAHRPDTIRSADRVVELGHGKILSDRVNPAKIKSG